MTGAEFLAGFGRAADSEARQVVKKSAPPPLKIVDSASSADLSPLILGAREQIKGCEHNARLLMLGKTELDAVYYDTFRQCIRNGERDWSDDDDKRVLIELQGHHRAPEFKIAHIRNAIAALAHERKRDSLREFVEGCGPWDGTARVERAFIESWGAPDTELVKAASRNFFVAAAARAMKPGAQVDTLWVFEGPQGRKKSMALRALGGELHAEISAAVGTLDFLREHRGIWFAEHAELDSLRGREASTVKRLLSATQDRFIEKFEVHARVYQRRAIAVATTNEAQYWEDATGARRLIPITVGEVRVDLIRENRLQWFAEALQLFRRGATWWEFPSTLVDEQEDRQRVDPWEDLLREALAQDLAAGDGWISTASIMRDVLKLHPSQLGAASGVRLGRVMRRLGFTAHRRGKGRDRGWRQADTSEPTDG